MTGWYKLKWICPKCDAVHFYNAPECQNCKYIKLREHDVETDRPTDELRLEIDEHRLDKEWIGQPKLYHVWAEKAAAAHLDVDRQKALLDVVAAEVELAIRNDPDSYGLSKITEGVIKAAILLQPEHKGAVKRLAKARYDLNIANAAVNALEHRKRALEKLVDLHGREYFASPQANTETRAEMARRAVRGGGRGRRSGDDE